MTGGGRFRLDRQDRIALAFVGGSTLVISVVNALTVGDDLGAMDPSLEVWEPWVWELTSALFWIVAAIPLLRLLRRLRPPHLAWPAAFGALVLVSIPVCAAHVAFLGLSRAWIYDLLGSSYSFDFAWAHLVYEWRKDVVSVLVLAGIGYLVDRLSDAAPQPAAAAAPFRLEVRDGVRTRWFAAGEIERVEAAGNYVELHTGSGTVLHRATLAAVAELLVPQGFTRIHRSRLIRRDAVTVLVTTASGDFEATLASGAVVAGSRRFRKDLAG